MHNKCLHSGILLLFTSDSQKISNIFNEHYATLGAKVQQKIPTEDGDCNFYLDKQDKNGKRFINPDGCMFYLSPAGPADIDKIIDWLSFKKSTGPYGIPVSFETGLFPDVLKIAKVNRTCSSKLSTNFSSLSE